MAQRQYVFKGQALSSWDQNINFYGILNPGRYCGFDTLEFVAPWQAVLKHSKSNLNFQDPNGLLKGPWGKFVTNQGSIITEEDPVGPFNIDNNASNPYWRYDIIVAEHSYDAVNNQPSLATYQLIKGATNSRTPTLPPLPNPHKQIFLAIIAIPPNATVHDKVGLFKIHTQSIGQHPAAKLYESNNFRGTQLWYQYPSEVQLPEENGWWALPAGGNTYKISPADWRSYNLSIPEYWDLWALRIDGMLPQHGSRITLQMPASVQLWDDHFPDDSNGSWLSKGFRGLHIPAEFTNKRIGNKNLLTQPAGCWDWFVELELISDLWVVKNVITWGGQSGNMASIITMDKSPIGGYNANTTTHVAAQGFFTAQGLDQETFYPTFSIKNRAGGLIFGEFNNEAIKILRGCTLDIRGSLCLRANFTGITQNELDNPLDYTGGGSIFLKLEISRAPLTVGNPATTEIVVLDYISKGSVKPQKTTAFTTGAVGSQQSSIYDKHMDIFLRGSKYLMLNPGDEIKLCIETVYADSRVSFQTFAYYPGMCCLEAHYMGVSSIYGG